jgi:hypothetical protein
MALLVEMLVPPQSSPPNEGEDGDAIDDAGVADVGDAKREHEDGEVG